MKKHKPDFSDIITPGLLTTKQAAWDLGVSQSRVRQLILAGRIKARKVGRDLFINPKDLKEYKEKRTARILGWKIDLDNRNSLKKPSHKP